MGNQVQVSEIVLSSFLTYSQSSSLHDLDFIGKTEAAKYIVNFLVHANDIEKSTHSSLGIKEAVAHGTLVLESFGNAKTIHNGNSSRFGNYIKLQYTEDNCLVSMIIETFILERSRLTSIRENERNYHVFYQLLRGLDPNIKSQLKLTTIEAYNILIPNSLTRLDSMDDIKSFRTLTNALLGVGCTENDLLNIWKILAAILHLGNLTFSASKSKSGALEINLSSCGLHEIAEWLGVSVDDLSDALLQHSITAGGETMSVKIKLLDQAAAVHNLHGLIKHLYSSLFDWLVQTINHYHASKLVKNLPSKYIGILDIFGFEIFEENSLEQLCINFANERLQHQFNEAIFASEQRVYMNEGISWTAITYRDNRPIIDLIAKKPSGLFNILEESSILNRSDDLTLLAQYHKIHGQSTGANAIYSKPRFGQDPHFRIQHYAGSVDYNINGFIEKNNDALQSDLSLLLQESSNPFLREVLRHHQIAGCSSSQELDQEVMSPRRRSSVIASALTVSSQLRQQLDKLIHVLSDTSSSYIKCIKANANQRPDDFTASLVLSQLRYLDILNIIAIRKARFPIVHSYLDFYRKYELLLHNAHSIRTRSKNCSLEEAKRYSALILRQLQQQPQVIEGYACGKSLVFLREQTSNSLNQAMNQYLGHYAIILQKHARRYLVQSAYREHVLMERRQQQQVLQDLFSSSSQKKGSPTNNSSTRRGSNSSAEKLFRGMSSSSQMEEDDEEEEEDQEMVASASTVNPQLRRNLSPHPSRLKRLSIATSQPSDVIGITAISLSEDSAITSTSEATSTETILSPSQSMASDGFGVSPTSVSISPSMSKLHASEKASPRVLHALVGYEADRARQERIEANLTQRQETLSHNLSKSHLHRASASGVSPSPRARTSLPGSNSAVATGETPGLDISEDHFEKYLEESKVLEDESSSMMMSLSNPTSRDTTPHRKDGRRKSPHRLDEERRIRREVERRRQEDILRRAEEKRMIFEQEKALEEERLKLGLAVRRDSTSIRRDQDSLQNRLEAERLRRRQAERSRKQASSVADSGPTSHPNRSAGGVHTSDKSSTSNNSSSTGNSSSSTTWNGIIEQAVNDITVGVNEITTGITSGLAPVNEWTQPVNEWFSGFATWGSTSSKTEK
jgi:myosin heavy subunit